MARTLAHALRYRTVDGVEEKHCMGCDTWKQLPDFYNHRTGYSAYCKPCSLIRRHTERHGSATNHGYVLFSEIKDHLQLVLLYYPTGAAAARAIGISRDKLSFYQHHAPEHLQKQTAIKILLAWAEVRRLDPSLRLPRKRKSSFSGVYHPVEEVMPYIQPLIDEDGYSLIARQVGVHESRIRRLKDQKLISAGLVDEWFTILGIYGAELTDVYTKKVERIVKYRNQAA